MATQTPVVQRGEGGYADWVIIALQVLRVYLDHPYRRLMDVLHEMPRIVEILDLNAAELRDFAPVCARMQGLKMRVWRVLLRLWVEPHDTGGIQAIDATGYDRVSASQHYAKWTDYTFEAVKTSALDDCKTSVILDMNCSMKQPHDTQVEWQVLTRNLTNLSTVTVNKGYDWDDLRQKLRDNDVRPVIKHREFYGLDAAHTARICDNTNPQRSNIEVVFFALLSRFGDTLRSRTWYGQMRELVLKATIRNLELHLNHSLH